MLSAFHALLKTSKNRRAERDALRAAENHSDRRALTEGFNAMFTHKVKRQKAAIQGELNSKVRAPLQCVKFLGAYPAKLTRSFRNPPLTSLSSAKDRRKVPVRAPHEGANLPPQLQRRPFQFRRPAKFQGRRLLLPVRQKAGRQDLQDEVR